MKKSAFIFLILIGVAIVITGFFAKESITCDKPYVMIGATCCLDDNNNEICDSEDCISITTHAKNSSGYCRDFPTSCIPKGWETVDECPLAETEPLETCSDEIQNQGETRIDCGGPCPPCMIPPPVPTCYDGIQNQGETGIDCGGPCMPCLPSCHDGIQNQGETGIDCGGPCSKCPVPIWTYNITERINDIAVSYYGDFLVLGSDDDYVYYLNKTGNLSWRYKAKDDVKHVGISNYGEYVVASSGNDVLFFGKANKSGVISYTRKYRVGDDVMDVSMSGAGDYVAVGRELYENLTVGDQYMFFFDKSGYLIRKRSIISPVSRVAVSSLGHYAAVNYGLFYVNNVRVNLGLGHAATDIINPIKISRVGNAVGVGINKIYFVGKDGVVDWTYNVSNVSGIEISDNNNVVVGSDRVYLFDGNGDLKWTYDAGYNIVSVGISSSGEYVAVASEDRYLYLFDKNGNLQWKYFTGYKIHTILITATDDHLIATTHGGSIYFFDVDLEI